MLNRLIARVCRQKNTSNYLDILKFGGGADREMKVEIRFSDHGYSNKLDRDVPKCHIKKSIKKAKLPKGNYKAYIYDKEKKYYIVASKKYNILRIITIVTEALDGMCIHGRNPVIRIV